MLVLDSIPFDFCLHGHFFDCAVPLIQLLLALPCLIDNVGAASLLSEFQSPLHDAAVATGVNWTTGLKRYDGEWVAGKRSGHGVAEYSDGRRFDGSWLNNEPHGAGSYTCVTFDVTSLQVCDSVALLSVIQPSGNWFLVWGAVATTARAGRVSSTTARCRARVVGGAQMAKCTRYPSLVTSLCALVVYGLLALAGLRVCRVLPLCLCSNKRRGSLSVVFAGRLRGRQAGGLRQVRVRGRLGVQGRVEGQPPERRRRVQVRD